MNAANSKLTLWRDDDPNITFGSSQQADPSSGPETAS
jgi:hypothetical protein